MSGTTIIYLRCDGCGETYVVDQPPRRRTTSAGKTLAAQRGLARSDGWRTNLPGGRDLCDTCCIGRHPGNRPSPVKAAVRDAMPADGTPISKRDLASLVAAACPDALPTTITSAITDMAGGSGSELVRVGYGVYRRRSSSSVSRGTVTG